MGLLVLFYWWLYSVDKGPHPFREATLADQLRHMKTCDFKIVFKSDGTVDLWTILPTIPVSGQSWTFWWRFLGQGYNAVTWNKVFDKYEHECVSFHHV